MTRLQKLYIDGTLVTDTGLENLKRFTELRELNLAGTEVTDTGLEHLKKLDQLQELVLKRTARHRFRARTPQGAEPTPRR